MNRVAIFVPVLAGATLALSLAGMPKAVAQLPSQVLRQEQSIDVRPQVAQQQATLIGPTQFDGVYSVEVVVEDGKCANSHWTVAVSHGQIASVSPNNNNISASGLIEDDGVVSMTFRGGDDQIAHVGGTVKGNSGKGAWSSPTLLCGGVWRADKEK